MAQLTYGIQVEWGVPGLEDAAPSSWTKIPDVISIPVLVGAPSNHDVTTIYDAMKTYLEGLPDNGGQLAFGVLFTPALLEQVIAIQTQQSTSNPYFRVKLPEPLNKAYTFRGTLAMPSNDEWNADAPITGKLNITPSTAIDFGEATA